MAALAAAGLALLLGGFEPLRSLDARLGDLLLSIPSPRGSASPPLALVLLDDRSVDEMGPLPWPHERLAELIRRIQQAGSRGIAFDLLLPESPGRGVEALRPVLREGEVVLAATLSRRGRWLLPDRGLGGASIAGHAEGEVEGDGVVRSVLATKQTRELSLPALGVAAARLYDPSIPVQAGRRLYPSFRSPPAELARYSAVDLLEGHTDPAGIEGRVVLVGVSAAGAGDRFVLPRSGSRPAPGVYLHAAVAASVLEDDLLYPLPGWWIFLLALVATWSSQQLRSAGGSLRIRDLGFGLGSIVLLALAGLWIAGLRVPMATMLLALALVVAWREVSESRSAARASGELLLRLRDELGASCAGGGARSARERLEVLRHLQLQLAQDRALRSTLLEALDEGVVYWIDEGEPILANRAALRLWGEPPHRDQLPPGGRIQRQGRHLEVTIHPLEKGSLGVLRDVTAEEELENRRAETRRLVSHELRTPLSSLAGFGEMLQRYELSEPELHQVAGRIRSEAARLHEMVSNYLDLERLGPSSGERQEVELRRLVANRLAVLDVAAPGRLCFDPDLDEVPVLADPELLIRVFDNLVGNAFKYAPSGPVRVEVAKDGNEVALRISDEGPGIPEEARERLFERFYRVPGRAGTGSGLGLALVREIAEWHGGCVEWTPESGGGSCFTVRLPARTHER